MRIIGIDAGSSNIKIVEVDENLTILNKALINETSISVLEAFENFVKINNIKLEEISKIAITGVNQKQVDDNIHGIKVLKVNEFEAVGKGAMHLAKIEEALIISIGTGTSFVKVKNNHIKHIGGTGIGGGTLINLCKKFVTINKFNEIEEIIKNANLNNIDLKLKDISDDAINSLLPMDITVANFGKFTKDATNNDIVLGILNMVVEVIAMMGIFATQNSKNKDIIVVGSITELTYLRMVLKKLGKLQQVNFIIPKNAEWSTALGAIKVTI